MSKLSRVRRPFKAQLNRSADDFKEDPPARPARLKERQPVAKVEAEDSAARCTVQRHVHDQSDGCPTVPCTSATKPDEESQVVQLGLSVQNPPTLQTDGGSFLNLEAGNQAVLLPDCPFCGKDFRLILFYL
jgi:hypothetical protein